MKGLSNLKFSLCFLSLALFLLPAYRTEALLYFENQLVSGPIISMQKTSTGFDYLKKYSNDFKDLAVLSLQGRLALYENNFSKLEPEVYNAFLKLKGQAGDLWFGHNRLAFGLSSYFNSHALLFSTLSMDTFGFDIDWGLGFNRDYDWGDISLSATTNSGMNLILSDNYLLAGRISKGIIGQENYNLGLSLAYSHDRYNLAGLDLNYLVNNLEFKTEIVGPNYSFREGVSLAEEGRLKFESQQTVMGPGHYQLGLGVTFIIDSNLTLRGLWQYDSVMYDQKVALQVYSYSLLTK